MPSKRNMLSKRLALARGQTETDKESPATIYEGE
jgi:hypothetical protein